MDIKSTFLYGKIEEESSVVNHHDLKMPYFPDKFTKGRKGSYGCKQAPKSFGMINLVNYLLDNEFQRGNIDKTLFIKRDKGDITVSFKCELTFFLGLQVKQKEDGIFISQDKSMDLEHDVSNLSSRLDIMFTVLLVDSPFDLVAYTDNDYAGASLYKKSTTRAGKKELRDIVRIKTKRELVRIKIDDGNAFWNEIGVTAGDSKLMVLGIHLLLPVLVNAVRHKLTTAG
ncbi:hypothetical protein Tco_1051394 [Tanacetum coccineum]